MVDAKVVSEFMAHYAHITRYRDPILESNERIDELKRELSRFEAVQGRDRERLASGTPKSSVSLSQAPSLLSTSPVPSTFSGRASSSQHQNVPSPVPFYSHPASASTQQTNGSSPHASQPLTLAEELAARL